MTKTCRDIEKQIAAVKRIMQVNKIMKESDDEIFQVPMDCPEETKDIGRKKA
jgi:DNA-binding FrmR family transcriptional regulator